MPTKPGKYNWDEISILYQQGYVEYNADTNSREHKFPTHKQLSEKFDIAVETIQQRSAKEQWSLKRELFRTKIRAKLQEKSVSDLFCESSKHDIRNLNKIDQLHRLIDIYLTQYQILSDPDNGDMILSEDAPRIAVRDLESLMRLLKESHHLSRSILGDPIHSDFLSSEAQDLNSTDSKSDPRERKNRIKKLSTKLDSKDKREQELLAKKHELEAQLKILNKANKTDISPTNSTSN